MLYPNKRSIGPSTYWTVEGYCNNGTISIDNVFLPACKLALMNYVKKLETASDLKVVPQHEDNPWNYKIYSKLCRLIMKKVDRDVAEQMGHGWDQAFVFHVKDWTQNDLSVEEVQHTMPFVLRFLDIVEKELIVDQEMALYVEKKLFTTQDLDKLAIDINTEAKAGKVSLLLQNFKRKDKCKGLNDVYQ
ncbi:unnamed protein product [Auanema sp. JU1783]|nr:unnamed protein product [Auanema sp. JU1783]